MIQRSIQQFVSSPIIYCFCWRGCRDQSSSDLEEIKQLNFSSSEQPLLSTYDYNSGGQGGDMPNITVFQLKDQQLCYGRISRYFWYLNVVHNTYVALSHCRMVALFALYCLKGWRPRFWNKESSGSCCHFVSCDDVTCRNCQHVKELFEESSEVTMTIMISLCFQQLRCWCDISCFCVTPSVIKLLHRW